MESSQNFPYTFIQKSFDYNKVNYVVAMTPELYPEDGALDFTGSYIGMFISSDKGTQSFELHPDSHSKWQSEPKGMDPGLIDILDNMINELRAN